MSETKKSFQEMADDVHRALDKLRRGDIERTYLVSEGARNYTTTSKSEYIAHLERQRTEREISQIFTPVAAQPAAVEILQLTKKFRNALMLTFAVGMVAGMAVNQAIVNTARDVPAGRP